MAILFPPASTSLPTSKSSSSAVVPIFTNCPMATSFLGPGLFRNSFRRAALDLNSVLASISAPTPRSAFHIPNRRKRAISDTSETEDQPPTACKDKIQTRDPRLHAASDYSLRTGQPVEP